MTAFACNRSPKTLNLLIGSYASSDQPGITLCQFDTQEATFQHVSQQSGIESPSFLTLSLDQQFLYSVSETDIDAKVFAYRYNKTDNSLSLIHHIQGCGAAPCNIWVDQQCKLVVTANYNGGNITLFDVQNDGSLTFKETISYTGNSIDSLRQTKPYLHCAYASPDGKYLYCNDLGSDRIYKYQLKKAPDTAAVYLEKGVPEYFQTNAGDGPRHSVFHPNGKYMYLIGELSGNVSLFDYHHGDLTLRQTVECDSLHVAGSADIHISPDGRHLYASNRLTNDGIAIYDINPQTGILTPKGYCRTGKHPRNFIITPDGNYLLCACRDDNKVEVYRRNQSSGLLHKCSQELSVSQPVCLVLAEP